MNHRYRKRLREITPLDALAPKMIDELLQQADLVRLQPGEVLFRQGDMDGDAVYLMEGSVVTENARRARTRTINADDARARFAVGNLQPRPFSLRAGTDGATVMRVDRQWVEGLVARSQMVSSEQAPAITVTDFHSPPALDHEWMFDILLTPLLRDLPTTSIERLFAAVEPLEIEGGSTVIIQGGRARYYYMIARGHCAVERKEDGQKTELAVLGPGDSFGEAALLNDTERGAAVRMKTDGLLMRLPEQAFEELLFETHVHAVSSADTARAIRDADCDVIDVRMPNEHHARCIRGTRNIPLYQLREQLDDWDGAGHVIAYCDSGERSRVAAFLCCEHGIRGEYLDGGLASLAEDSEDP